MAEDRDDQASGPRLLRRARNHLGFSQERLAEEAGLAVRTIRALEHGGVVSPRRDTIDRIVDSLGLTNGQRCLFLSAWGLTDGRRVVAAHEIIHQPDRHPQTLQTICRRMDRTSTTYTKSVAFVGPLRRIIRHLVDRVSIAEVAGVTGVPVIDVADPPARQNTGYLRPLEGCRVARRPCYRDATISVFEIEFGRALKRGEAYPYSWEQCYQVTEGVAADPDLGSCGPWSGRNVKVGLHRAARLGVVRVVFRPDDPPRRCVHLFETRLGGGYQELGEVPVSAGGTADIAVPDPLAGWHGIGWEW